MPQLRRNHQTSSSSWGIPIIFGLVGLVIIGFLLLGKDFIFSLFTPKVKDNSDLVDVNHNNQSQGNTIEIDTISSQELIVDPDRPYLPTSNGQIIYHDYYTLSYIEDVEQAEWVCYRLTQADLRRPNVPRSDYFEEDPKVATGSATFYDYKGSGYTKGHLVPAADMAYSTDAMQQTFYMSNMSPQLRGFNNGIWRELEEVVRDWTYHNKSLYIASGPIFNENIRKTKKGLGIPDYFYKVILDLEQPEQKAIAFKIPHELSIDHLEKYMVPIDEIERLTGINFFHGVMDGDEESRLEATYDVSKWKISYDRFLLRVNHWNNE